MARGLCRDWTGFYYQEEYCYGSQCTSNPCKALNFPMGDTRFCPYGGIDEVELRKRCENRKRFKNLFLDNKDKLTILQETVIITYNALSEMGFDLEELRKLTRSFLTLLVREKIFIELEKEEIEELLKNY